MHRVAAEALASFFPRASISDGSDLADALIGWHSACRTASTTGISVAPRYSAVEFDPESLLNVDVDVPVTPEELRKNNPDGYYKACYTYAVQQSGTVGELIERIEHMSAACSGDVGIGVREEKELLQVISDIDAALRVPLPDIPQGADESAETLAIIDDSI